ncbi:hypothetical protein P8452_02365 [Trifolium repens]|jgi:hypothetical protein|nr:hypothetical protein QL285_002578 [Trifolium repens]WJX11797.1 hypothetical protein P8452_02365 [Trifolium repens]
MEPNQPRPNPRPPLAHVTTTPVVPPPAGRTPQDQQTNEMPINTLTLPQQQATRITTMEKSQQIIPQIIHTQVQHTFQPVGHEEAMKKPFLKYVGTLKRFSTTKPR